MCWCEINAHAGTFDVQDADIQEISNPTGAVSVSCTFATGSQAKGCLVHFQSAADNDNCTQRIAREHSEANVSATITLPNGIYTNIQVYDIESNNEPEMEHPAYVHNHQIEIRNSAITGII